MTTKAFHDAPMDSDRTEPAPRHGPSARPDTLFGATLAALRGDMLRFAALRLRDPATAEDLVQESIEVALRKAATFAGQSSVKTWVFAILKHRIIDHLRSDNRCVPLSSLVADGDDWQQQLDALFDARGTWHRDAGSGDWPDPEAALRSRQFWHAFERCLDHLPANAGRVFVMREVLGFEVDEICAQLRITANNCHVILHRARLKLRTRVDTGWGRA